MSSARRPPRAAAARHPGLALGDAGRRRLRLRLRRPRPRVVLAMIVVLALIGGAYLWLRSSPLVAVHRVTVTGVSGPDAGAIRSALQGSARTMTTLDVDGAALRAAVKPYPVVKSLRVSAQFPHALRIAVIEQVPVAIVQGGGQRLPVSADGTLLPSDTVTGTLPTITVAVAPGGTHLSGASAQEAALLAAAPYGLLAKVQSVSDVSGVGLMAVLRAGPKVYFGDTTQLAAKWSALIDVLASPSSVGADYIDVTVPGRPAAGTGSDTGLGTTTPSTTSTPTPGSTSSNVSAGTSPETTTAPQGAGTGTAGTSTEGSAGATAGGSTTPSDASTSSVQQGNTT